MNNLQQIDQWQNVYYALRHGESEANTSNVAVGDPTNGIPRFPLTPTGRKQVQTSVEQSDLMDTECIIYHSPFLRTVQTAEIAAAALHCDELYSNPALQERFLGDFELQKDAWSNYEKMWAADLENPDHHLFNLESVNEVLVRTTQCILDCENKHSGKTIILVSHADPIKILQTAFSGIDAHKHQTNIPMPQHAELRRLSV